MGSTAPGTPRGRTHSRNKGSALPSPCRPGMKPTRPVTLSQTSPGTGDKFISHYCFNIRIPWGSRNQPQRAPRFCVFSNHFFRDSAGATSSQHQQENPTHVPRVRGTGVPRSPFPTCRTGLVMRHSPAPHRARALSVHLPPRRVPRTPACVSQGNDFHTSPVTERRPLALDSRFPGLKLLVHVPKETTNQGQNRNLTRRHPKDRRGRGHPRRGPGTLRASGPSTGHEAGLTLDPRCTELLCDPSLQPHGGWREGRRTLVRGTSQAASPSAH